MNKNRISATMFALILGAALGFSGCSSADNGTAADSTGVSGGIVSGTTVDTSRSVAETGASTAGYTATTVEFKKKDLNSDFEESSSTVIALEGDSAIISGEGASADGSVITISDEGDYVVSGKFNDGQLIVEAGDEDDVRIILNGADITCSNSACIYVKNCDKCIITLADGTENSLTDGNSYVYDDTEKEEPNAVIFSKDDLSFNGSGTLTIKANFAHAINCKDDLKFAGGVYNITAKEDGIKGKDSLAIADGVFTIEAGDDGMRSDNDLIIDGGTINILKSYEGLEALAITINGGQISVTASDDGLNAAGGDGSSSNANNPFGGGNPFATTEGACITINGGTLYVNAGGDGIDSNKDLYVNGGVIMVDGPTDNGNGALDHNGEAVITGGTIVASGSSGMIENFESSSTQNVILIYFSSAVKAGSSVSVKDSDGNEVLSFTTGKQSQCAITSCEGYKTGETYTVYVNGTEDATVTCDSVISSNGSTNTGFGGMGGHGGFQGGNGGFPGGNGGFPGGKR